jgi:NAD(P) transhydrogenase subunit alpha
VIGAIAIAFGTINIVGGFLVTDRMLGMFSRKPKPSASSQGASATDGSTEGGTRPGADGSDQGSGSDKG